jgi:hypothetical protein
VNEMQGGKGSSLYGTVMPSSAQTGGALQRVFSTSRKALTRAELGDTLVTKSRHKCDPWGVNPFLNLCFWPYSFLTQQCEEVSQIIYPLVP